MDDLIFSLFDNDNYSIKRFSLIVFNYDTVPIITIIKYEQNALYLQSKHKIFPGRTVNYTEMTYVERMQLAFNVRNETYVHSFKCVDDIFYNTMNVLVSFNNSKCKVHNYKHVIKKI